MKKKKYRERALGLLKENKMK